MTLEKGPIFIAGLERSGTSLAYALLATHPNIAMTRRTNLWRYFAGQFGDLHEPANLDACLAKMQAYKRIVKLAPDYDKLRSDFLDGDRTYARLFQLVEEQFAERQGKPRWGDKSLNTERFTEEILSSYPGARIIHMLRDPRDRYASVLARWKQRRGDVGAGTAAWLWSARLGMSYAETYPSQYRVVRYESLVANPPEELQRLCSFIDEPYHPEMLSMAGAARFRDDGANSSYGPREAGVISSDSVGKFRSVLSPRQIAVIQAMAASDMTRLGYEPVSPTLTNPERLRLVAVDLPYHRLVNVAWRAREAYRDVRGRRLPDYRLVGAS